ncbi:hypothetical protein IGI04_021168 [Brassica rapa subsp. trilocularis]|uniref:Uncharacterized protein n=1 Tax=Brassica rapa subsp. trilocularis TaxID=1813537 RepID=A0ABQ7MKU7_BRACM|nr:hypothetical protein IGI04_021168 [Brassica rapa subsp. trilocularis]
MEDAASPNSGSDLNLGGNRGRSIEECQDMIQRSFRNPIVKFLMEQQKTPWKQCGIHVTMTLNLLIELLEGYTPLYTLKSQETYFCF